MRQPSARRTAAVLDRHFNLNTCRFTLNRSERSSEAEPAGCLNSPRGGLARTVHLTKQTRNFRPSDFSIVTASRLTPEARDHATVIDVPDRTVGGQNVAAHTKRPAQSGLSQERATQDVVARDAIALRAYELFQERGQTPGRELDDWLRAEREMQEATRHD